MALPIGLDQQQVTIAANASATGQINLGGERLCGIQVPATGWITANLTFSVSTDGGTTFQPMYDSAGNEYTVQAAGGRYIKLPSDDFVGINCLEIISGSHTSPVAQTSAQTLTLVLKPPF